METQGGSGDPQELTKGQRKRLSLRVPGRVGDTECDAPHTRAGANWSPEGGHLPSVLLSTSRVSPVGGTSLEGCHREPLPLPRTCRHWSLKCLHESWAWGSTYPQPPLALCGGAPWHLTPEVVIFDPRSEGNWGLGFRDLDLDLRRKEEGNNDWGYRRDPYLICKIAFLHVSLASLSFSRGPKSKFTPTPQAPRLPFPFLVDRVSFKDKHFRCVWAVAETVLREYSV